MRAHRLARAVAVCLIAALPLLTPARAEGLCESAGSQAEAAYDLPAGLLLAIGRIESGRWDPVRRQTVPWPWTIDVAGEGRQFPNAAEAVRATQALRDGGARNIDVGCFQVSLLHHPDAFQDLYEAFDPTANGRYAGRLLASLKARLGSWEDAVAAYHSADPARGTPYRQRVYASWRGAPVPAPAVTEVAAGPAVLAFGIRLWTPSQAGSAASLIQMAPTRSGHPMPRVINGPPR